MAELHRASTDRFEPSRATKDEFRTGYLGRCSSVFISHRGALEGLVLSASLFFVRIPPVWTLFAQPFHGHLGVFPQLPDGLECAGVDTSSEYVALRLKWESFDEQTDGLLLTHVGWLLYRGFHLLVLDECSGRVILLEQIHSFDLSFARPRTASHTGRMKCSSVKCG
ncbi:unnamed protein product [Vitrella brassicaformis CCMP3155]|uniref:Uncharacterized protein n=1 Tax=Vitrella brassicaformis (strain CCMP3155) TaxID=1169540 RepID=A0A0G4GKV7_VITBC|nr:unnamed protein product [Vitrella brassicaformis CCMP3155]|eukprot:CEM30669.1 unnamed protein product [Vitrella brassicaformis CCMP3155]